MVDSKQSPSPSSSTAQQPATPRMLRSMSGSFRNSSEQMQHSHSRNPSSSSAAHPPNSFSHSQSRQEKELLPPPVMPSPQRGLQSPHANSPSMSRSPQASHNQQSSHHRKASQPSPQQQPQPQQQQQQQQFYRRSIGDWDFIRTIGAGSMGKVKLAKHNTTNEKCAVKIVPRAAKLYQRAHAHDPPVKNAEEANQRQKEFEKEIARDKRTIREGALGRMLFHPHICRLYEMVPMTNHYYMLFEYVEGGQLLDYIVSHGSLNEKYARKFGRGIASALDYCHKNNVVHRDLKIENIMINQKGEIKIIDFGLSNLYTPHHLLKTYCGSLYFAAPELLCAKPYTGPEVDVWSFGVVLYVLVCGKVPFDDPVVSVLHEKIKKGRVEYPSFISRECVSLLSRMLVVDPSKRATLAEVIQHPWLNKGYEYPVSSYTPPRVPLTLPLDPSIIQTIASFDLGTVQSLTEELTRIVASTEYQLCSDNWYKHSGINRFQTPGTADPVHGFHPLVSIYFLVDEMKKRKRAKEEALQVQVRQPYTEAENVRRSEPVYPPQPSYPSPKPNQRDATAHDPNRFDASPSKMPIRGSSMNSKDLSRQNYSTPPMGKPRSPPPPPPSQQAPPALSFPEQAHTSVMSNSIDRSASNLQREEAPEQTFSQQQSPRGSIAFPETLDPNAGKPNGFNSLLRKMSGKRSKNLSPSPRKEDSPGFEQRAPMDASSSGVHNDALLPPTNRRGQPESSVSSEKDPFVRRGVSMKVTAKERSDARLADNLSGLQTDNRSQNSGVESHKSHGRSHSTATKPPGYVPSEYLPPLPNINTNQLKTTVSPDSNKANDDTSNSLRVNTKFHPTARAKSVGSHVRKDSSYYRGSNDRPALPNAMASQNSDEGVDLQDDSHEISMFDDVNIDDTTHSVLPPLTEEQIVEQFNHAKRNSMPSIEYPKTLFLKGFFSVQTTSTKPLPVIRYNILTVLSKLGVKFHEVKGGFVCAHSAISVPKKSENDGQVTPTASTIIDEYRSYENVEERRLYGDAFNPSFDSLNKQKESDGVKTPEGKSTPMNIPQIVTPQQTSKQPSRQGSIQGSGPAAATSPTTFVKGHRSSNSMNQGHRRKFSIGQAFVHNYKKKNGSQTLMPPNTPAAAKLNKVLSGHGDLADEDLDEDTLAQLRRFSYDDSMDSINGEIAGGGSDMLVSSRLEQKARHRNSGSTASDDDSNRGGTSKTPIKFEINIVKVPLVGLYGVQFKKNLGNTWSYKALASEILNELNL